MLPTSRRNIFNFLIRTKTECPKRSCKQVVTCATCQNKMNHSLSFCEQSVTLKTGTFELFLTIRSRINLIVFGQKLACAFYYFYYCLVCNVRLTWQQSTLKIMIFVLLFQYSCVYYLKWLKRNRKIIKHLHFNTSTYITLPGTTKQLGNKKPSQYLKHQKMLLCNPNHFQYKNYLGKKYCTIHRSAIIIFFCFPLLNFTKLFTLVS